MLTSVAGAKSQKLDLAFALQAYESAMALAESGEQYNLGVGAQAFLDRNNHNFLVPTHHPTFKKGDGRGKTNTAYGLTSLIGHTSRRRTIHRGSHACDQCQRGKGNFADCVTVATDQNSLFSGACTNCAGPNRYKDCSFYSGEALGPAKAPVAGPVSGTRLVTRSRAATQPKRNVEVQVVIPVSRRARASTVADSARSATPLSPVAGSSRHESPPDNLYNLSLSPQPRRQGPPSTIPESSPPPAIASSPLPAVASSSGDLPAAGGVFATGGIQHLQLLPRSEQQEFIRSEITWMENSHIAAAWREGNTELSFQHLVNPGITRGRRLEPSDALAQGQPGLTQSLLATDILIISPYGVSNTGATRISARALGLLYLLYRTEWAIDRRHTRYSSIERDEGKEKK